MPEESRTSSAAKGPRRALQAAGLSSSPPPHTGALGSQQKPLGTPCPAHLLEYPWDLPGSYLVRKKGWEEPSLPYKF